MELRKLTCEAVIYLIIDEAYESEKSALEHIIKQSAKTNTKTGFSQCLKKAYKQYKDFKYTQSKKHSKRPKTSQNAQAQNPVT